MCPFIDEKIGTNIVYLVIAGARIEHILEIFVFTAKQTATAFGASFHKKYVKVRM